MPYVERRDSRVVGRYARPQPGYAEEWLDDGHPDLTPPPTAEEVAAEAERTAQQQLRLDAKALAMFDALKGATLTQIDAWIDANFSGMTAQQRAFLKMVAAGVALYLRER